MKLFAKILRIFSIFNIVRCLVLLIVYLFYGELFISDEVLGAVATLACFEGFFLSLALGAIFYANSGGQWKVRLYKLNKLQGCVYILSRLLLVYLILRTVVSGSNSSVPTVLPTFLTASILLNNRTDIAASSWLFHRSPTYYTPGILAAGNANAECTLPAAEWTVENYADYISERVAYLRNYSRLDLDYSEKSLLRLWRWFRRQCKADFLTGEQLVEPVRFSVETESILHDISLYFTKAILENNTTISLSVCEDTGSIMLYYLKDYIDILDKINVVFLQITLDGNKERHNQTRILVNGKGTYDTVLESIKLSLQRGLPTIVRMNVSPDNIDGCLETKQYIESQGWGKDNLWFDLQPIFQTTHSEHANLYSTLLDDDVESAKKNLNLKHLPPISNFLYNKVPLKPIIKACDADCFYRFYDPHGDIYSCIASVGDKRKRIGTYWPELTYEDKSFLTRDITTIPKCKSCKFALLCGGGCANAVNPDLDITETPNCYTMYNDINVTVPSVYRLMKERDERHA